jgi:hypothetical protein
MNPAIAAITNRGIPAAFNWGLADFHHRLMTCQVLKT